MMLRRALLLLFAALAVAQTPAAARAHPQDGPHADLRVAIEDDLVRYSVGINLAFLDEVVAVPREAPGELTDAEADLVLEAFREMLTEQAPCSINGEAAEPVFERLEIFKDPDPGMVAIFERTGARGLIRATAVMRFDTDVRTETVEVTWPAYPIDQLAVQMENPTAVRPRMYFEAVFTAGGKSIPSKFTEAEPTIRWSRDAAAETDLLASLPEPLTSEPRGNAPLATAILLVLAVVMLGIAGTVRTTPSRSAAVVVAIVLGGSAFAWHTGAAPRAGDTPQPLVTETQATDIMLAVHESLYRAFDYTAESDIYDRLELALAGDLLGELYEQIRLSLLQAEDEMKIGVVTRLEPLDTTITLVDAAGPNAIGRGFDALHRWRVDGTVYHWGHSHTRSHEYEAAYRVAYTDGGWRITEHELRSQQRIDPVGGNPVEDVDPLQRALELLGRPDF